MAIIEHWEFDKPHKCIAADGRLTITGHFRQFPDSKPIRYFYYPRERQLFLNSAVDLWWVFHKCRVERLSKTRFRLTPITQNFTVEAHRAIF